MRFPMLAWSLVLLFLAPLSLGASQEDEGCRRCDHQGVVVCPKHDKEIIEAEGRVHFCSVVARCSECAGALRIDCRHCEGGPGVAPMETRRAEIATWLLGNKIEEHFGRSVPRCETDHLALVFETGAKIKEGRKTVDPHVLMHQVADDCEHVASRITEHFKVEEGAFPAKMRMWLWGNSKDHVSAIEEFMKISARGDFKMLGKDPVFSVWQEPGLFSSAHGIRSVFGHNIGHMLISNLDRELDISVTGGGWFDAGVGHWYEYDRYERSVNYCSEEASIISGFANGVWKATMRKLVEKSDDRLFVPLMKRPTTAMSAKEQAVCWSFYDYLVDQHGEKLRPILRGLKIKTESRELFKEHLGMTTLEAEDAWRTWVSATYPKKDLVRRR